MGVIERKAPEAPPSDPFLPYGANRSRMVMRPRDLQEGFAPSMWTIMGEHFKTRFDRREPLVAVDVGSQRGVWAAGLMQSTETAKVFSVDAWVGRVGNENLRTWFARMERWAFRRAFPMKGTADEMARIFPFAFDLLYLDGQGPEVSVTDALRSWVGMLSPGGLFFLDRYERPEVRAAAESVLTEMGITVSNGSLAKGCTVAWGVR